MECVSFHAMLFSLLPCSLNDIYTPRAVITLPWNAACDPRDHHYSRGALGEHGEYNACTKNRGTGVTIWKLLAETYTGDVYTYVIYARLIKSLSGKIYREGSCSEGELNLRKIARLSKIHKPADFLILYTWILNSGYKNWSFILGILSQSMIRYKVYIVLLRNVMNIFQNVSKISVLNITLIRC